jgi:addiction module RelE/StbE family toxin
VRVRWLNRALRDLDEAEAYIARDDPQAAASVVLRIVRTVSLLKDQPGIGRAGRVPGTKELIVPNTPFIIPYRVKDETVQILTVYHSSRKWPERL